MAHGLARDSHAVTVDYAAGAEMKRDTIRGQDVVFVVAAVLCELYTASRLFSYIFTITFHRGSDGLCTVCGQPEDEHHGREKRCYPNKARSAGDVEVTTLSLLADVGFSVGKLFPLAYSCEDPACAKITHNCVMTLSCWVFAALECAMLHQMVLNLREDGGKSRAAAVKLLELALCLAYVLYDLAPLAHSWSNADTFGVSTIVLIVLTCLAEVLLMAFEVYTICQACSWKKRGVHVHPGDRLVQDDVHELEALPSGQPA